MLKKFLILLTLIFGLGSIAQPASAFNAEDFSISLFPSYQTLELSPGMQREGTITIVNTGKMPFDFIVAASPYQVQGEEYDADFTTINNYTALAGWIAFDQESYHAEAGESVEVKFSINVPEDAVGGGQYAAIMAYTEDGANPDASIKVASQVAALLYGRVSGQDMRPEGEIAEQDIPFVVFDSNPLEASIVAYNTGNVDFMIYHTFTVTDMLSGEEIINPETTDNKGNKLGASSAIVLPGTSRRDTLVWETTPKIGLYKIKQATTFLDQTIESEQVVIFCPMWLVFAILGLILLLILWIILAVRHHHRKQPQVF